jgi:hypothetical protein
MPRGILRFKFDRPFVGGEAPFCPAELGKDIRLLCSQTTSVAPSVLDLCLVGCETSAPFEMKQSRGQVVEPKSQSSQVKISVDARSLCALDLGKDALGCRVVAMFVLQNPGLQICFSRSTEGGKEQ